jgi:hypothetical protein
MGIWSVYIHSYTPNITVDFALLPPNTLNFLNCKSEIEYNTASPMMTIDELGKGFVDCAKIWGYLEEPMISDMTGLIEGLSGTAEMIFECEDPFVPYYLIRFDKLTKTISVFLTKDKEVNSLDDIQWINL